MSRSYVFYNIRSIWLLNNVEIINCLELLAENSFITSSYHTKWSSELWLIENVILYILACKYILYLLVHIGFVEFESMMLLPSDCIKGGVIFVILSCNCFLVRFEVKENLNLLLIRMKSILLLIYLLFLEVHAIPGVRDGRGKFRKKHIE